MPPEFVYPPKPSRGDRVAVISPSGRAASLFPRPFELGLTRLREEFGLVPVEYPTTLAAEASPAERANDVHAAFADPAIKAVIASIGGEDELKVLRHLDPDVLPDDSYEGAVLFLETSEELPSADYVYRVLACMGERGLLQRFAAIVWGRPKAWSFEHRNSLADRAAYSGAQHEAVLTAVAEYHPGVPLVFGVDLGHTDPQYVIPSGGEVTVDAENHKFLVTY
jgi:muramoyltetrapeptide carboxypeptidase LdcA involved in peptidoglycan recycling